MKRRFQINTHLTLPLELHPAPGATHHKAEPGHVIELDAERCKSFDRFLRGRIRAGDIVELADQPCTAPRPPVGEGAQGAGLATAPVKE